MSEGKAVSLVENWITDSHWNSGSVVSICELDLACTLSTGPTVCTSFKELIQWYHTDNSKLTMMKVLKPWKLGNSINQGFCTSNPKSQMLNTYHHSTGYIQAVHAPKVCFSYCCSAHMYLLRENHLCLHYLKSWKEMIRSIWSISSW